MKNSYVLILILSILLFLVACAKEEEAEELVPLEDIVIELPEADIPPEEEEINRGEITLKMNGRSVKLQDASGKASLKWPCSTGSILNFGCNYKRFTFKGFIGNYKMTIQYTQRSPDFETKCLPAKNYDGTGGAFTSITYKKTSWFTDKISSDEDAFGKVYFCSDGAVNRDLRDSTDIIRPIDRHFSATFSGQFTHPESGEMISITNGYIDDMPY